MIWTSDPDPDMARIHGQAPTRDSPLSYIAWPLRRPESIRTGTNKGTGRVYHKSPTMSAISPGSAILPSRLALRSIEIRPPRFSNLRPSFGGVERDPRRRHRRGVTLTLPTRVKMTKTARRGTRGWAAQAAEHSGRVSRASGPDGGASVGGRTG